MADQPRVKAFLLCDCAIESTDGKHSVIGIFQRIRSVNFPVFHARFGVYVRLGEMRGQYTFKLQFIDMKSDSMLAEAMLTNVEHKNPLLDRELSVNLPGLHLQHPGTYEVRFFSNDDLIHVDTLHADMIDPNQFSAGQPEFPAPPEADDDEEDEFGS
jgi:hypothetical protein